MTSRLERIFQKPDGEYYPVPWWAWSGKLEPDSMRKQLALMHEQGIREFFIFPIYGMAPEYMSEDYLDRIAIAVDWCSRHDMKIWIYDELSWPSGTAAGLVSRRHPSAIASNIARETYTVDKLNDIQGDPSVMHVYQLSDDEVVAYRVVKDTTVNLTVMGCLWTQRDPGMLDMLSRSACAAFIEEAYEPIARRFPEHLGKTIKGFFTDEPSIAPGHIVWTAELPARFAAQFGYDLVPVLHELNYTTPTSERTRMHYWQLVSEMSSEAFTGQIADWCKAHGLLLTGHMVHEENSYSVWFQGDSPMHLMKMHVPGCDLLKNPTNFDETTGWYHFGANSLIKTPKDAGSAARFAGRDRVMCEAYGVLPWYKAMPDEKRLTDWLVALGVNLINDNSLISDISGFRKRGISGKHFTQPWWPHSHLYYDYAARISQLSAETKLDTELLVLYPTTTWWSMVVRNDAVSPELRALEVAFDNTLDALVRTHWDFEMLFEDVLAASTVENGTLVTSGGKFKAIIAAGITRLRPEAAAKLEQFAASGGTVIRVDSDIECVDGTSRPMSLPNAPALNNTSGSFRSDLDSALAAKLDKPWRIDGAESDGVISAARIDPDGRKVLFIANMTPGDKGLRLKWSGDESVELWDADAGKSWRPLQSNGSCSLFLPDGQSIWAVQAQTPSANSTPPAHMVSLGDSKPAVELNGPYVFRMDRPNLCKLGPLLLPDTDGGIDFGSPELEQYDGWITLDNDDAGIPLGSDSMQRYWLKADFTLGRAMPNLRIVGDSEDVEKAYLNGIDLGESVPETVWDDENRGWDASGAARVGANQLLLCVKASPYNSEAVAVFSRSIVEPVVLKGWFSVDSASGALTCLPDTMPIGDIRGNGLPHFAGTCVYQTDFTWPGPEGPVLISCEAGRDVVDVAIDGHGLSLGKRAWGRRAFRIDKLTPGPHRIAIRTTNTLGAILTRTYNAELTPDIPPSGLLAPVRLYSL